RGLKMNQRLFTFIVICCICTNLFANDRQATVYEMDQINQSYTSLLNEPLIQTIVIDQTAGDSTQLKSPKDSGKIKVRYPRQIFQIQRMPFIPAVIKTNTLKDKRLKVGRRPELIWHITVPMRFRQFNHINDQKLLTGGAFIYDTHAKKSSEVLYMRDTE
ncbi:MAG: hypothetical protein QM501_03710, partial [Gimesia sp.]